jgi:hypothetical protein
MVEITSVGLLKHIQPYDTVTWLQCRPRPGSSSSPATAYPHLPQSRKRSRMCLSLTRPSLCRPAPTAHLARSVVLRCHACQRLTNSRSLQQDEKVLTLRHADALRRLLLLTVAPIAPEVHALASAAYRQHAVSYRAPLRVHDRLCVQQHRAQCGCSRRCGMAVCGGTTGKESGKGEDMHSMWRALKAYEEQSAGTVECKLDGAGLRVWLGVFGAGERERVGGAEMIVCVCESKL